MKKTTLGLGVLALILGVVAISAESVMAYKGNHDAKCTNYTEERHTAMEESFKTGNYDDWKNLMQGKGKLTQIINEGNFAKFAEAHELMEQGNVTEAEKIRQELGLGQKDGLTRGKKHFEMHQGMNY